MIATAEGRDIPSMDEWCERLAAAAPHDVVIFQNVHDDGVLDRLDPSFLPVDGRGHARTEFRETGLFLRMFHTGLHRCAPLTGILSPSFTEKARIAGSAFLRFIRQNPGYDVYFVNPFPQFAYLMFNVWAHGEFYHPGLAGLAQLLFQRAGYDLGPLWQVRDTARTALYSNYWVAGPRFWDGYLTLLTRLVDALEAMPEALRTRYFAPDPVYPDPVPILPFVFERCFSTFLHANPTMRALAYPFARDEMLRYCDEIEREIVTAFADVIDEIDARGEYSQADRALFAGLVRLRAAAARREWR